LAREGRRSSAELPAAPRLARRHARLPASFLPRGAPPPPVPFEVGFPDPRHFPRATFARLAAHTLRGASPSHFYYGDPRGLRELREAIASYLASSRGVRCSAEELLIVHGSQQALELIGRVLLDPGDRVWLEEPGYHGARYAVLSSGAEVVPAPLDGEGLDLDAMRASAPPRLIAVTPSNQFPTGVTTSMARRLALLECARAHDAWIVEDDYDSEFRYRGAPIPALQGLDQDGRVLYVGTFSKTLTPALRQGYVVLPPALVDAFVRARAVVDHSPSPLLQAILASFLDAGHYGRHLARVRRIYRGRQAFLAECLAARGWRTWPADGGLHLVLELPPELDDRAAHARLRARGIASVPLSIFRQRPADPPAPALLLGYAGFAERELGAAVELLSDALGPAR
jgi:GntR family transcriptional regulator/MocR family aminotransferase